MKYIKTKLLVIFIVVITGLVSFQSCETDNSIESTEIKTEVNSNLKTFSFSANLLEVSQMFEDKKFQFKTTYKENITSSIFSIKNENEEIIYETEFVLDTGLKDYKLYQVEKVIDIANKLNYTLELNDYLTISEQLKAFMDSIVFQYKNKQIKPLLSSLFFHNSILNYKKRSIQEGKENCDCTLHPGYLLEKTGFFCQEDFLMPVSIIKSTINKNKDAFLSNSSIALTEYLNSTKEEFISFDKLYGFYIDKELYLKTLDLIKNGDKEKNNQSRGDCSWWCPLGCGSDWGCCGNYSGCCLYSHALCYIHDGLCTNCTPSWACFSGCVPDQ